MSITIAAIFNLLGFFGTVKIFKKNDLGPNWHCRFRIKPAGTVGRGKLVFVSTKTPDFNSAKIEAAKIFLSAVNKIQAQVTVGSSAAIDAASLESAQRNDPTIETVLQKYDDFVASATPGSRKHPRKRTARNNKNRLKQLCKLLDVKTVMELSDAYKGLSAGKIRERQRLNGDKDLITDANFVPLVRSAAGVFSIPARDHFQSAFGLVMKSPFPTLPPVIKKKFIGPSQETVNALKLWASETFSSNHRDGMLFILCLGLGLRQQEATHLRWRDIEGNTVNVCPRKTCRGRTILMSDRTLFKILELKPKNCNPDEWLVPDGEGPGLRRELIEVPDRRAERVARRVAGLVRAKLSELGMGFQKYPLHYLRKIFATKVQLRGGDAAKTADVLGNGVLTALSTYIDARNDLPVDVI